jgi:hypothetical protein
LQEEKMKMKTQCHSCIAIKGNAIGLDVEWVFGRVKRFLIMTLKIPININAAGLENEANDYHYDEFLVCQVSRFTVASRDEATGLYKVSIKKDDKTLIYVAPELIAKPIVLASLSPNSSLVLDCSC